MSNGIIKINTFTHQVETLKGEINDLRNKEYQILTLLLAHAPICVSRQELIAQVWSGSYSADATINQTIKSIRKKIGDTQLTLIQTVPRVGYQIEHPEFFQLESTQHWSEGTKGISTDTEPLPHFDKLGRSRLSLRANQGKPLVHKLLLPEKYGAKTKGSLASSATKKKQKISRLFLLTLFILSALISFSLGVYFGRESVSVSGAYFSPRSETILPVRLEGKYEREPLDRQNKFVCYHISVMGDQFSLDCKTLYLQDLLPTGSMDGN